jgi:LysM repeat protein
MPYKLRLRKKFVGDFINNENALYAFKTKNALSSEANLEAIYASYRETEQYTVKKGETLAGIAKKFHMTTEELKSLNSLKKNYVKPRQHILVYIPGSSPKIPDSLIRKQEMTAKADSTKSARQKKDSTKTEARQNEPEVAAPPKIHTVKNGETLGSIARKYKVTAAELMSWNNLSSSKVVVGQKLKIQGDAPKPAAATSASQKTSTAKTSPKPSNGTAKYFYYTIQPGDNLWDLADRFDVTVAQIKNINDIKNASYLKPGQKIKIPK